MNPTTHPQRQRAVLAALVTACTLALAACGGGNDDDTPTADTARFEVGDTYTVESASEGTAPTVRSFQVYGVSTKGELMASASDDLVPGVLVPLPLPLDSANTAKIVNADWFQPIDPEALRQTYQSLVQAKAQRDGAHNIYAAIDEIADLDGDTASIHADLRRSGLTPAQYLSFYDTLDQVPAFAAQDDAELQAMRFFDDVDDYELQGAACGSITGGDPCNRLPDCSSNNLGPWCGSSPAAAAAWIEALAGQRTHFAGFLSTMAARGDDFNALTGVYRSWRSQHPDAVMPGDFIAAYLAGPLSSTPNTEARAAATAKSIAQFGDLPCDEGKTFTFVDKNMVQSGIANGSACFSSMMWLATDIAVADGDTLRGPHMHFSVKKSGKKGEVLLAEMRAYWRVVYYVPAPRYPTQRWLDFTPVAKINVTELNTAPKVKLTAYASTGFDATDTGIALTVNVKALDPSMKNAPTIAPQTQRVALRGGFQ